MSDSDINIFTIDGLLPFTTRGDVLYRNATQAARLAAGTSGQYLKTTGSGGDPVWAAVPGFTGQLASSTSGAGTPADAATYYVGNLAGFAPGTSDGPPGYWVPVAGTLRAVYGRITVAGVLGSNDGATSQSSLIIRKNATTDIATLTTTQQMTSAANDFSSTGLSVAVNAGDNVYLKIVCGTWTTNPTLIIVNLNLYFDLP